MNNKRVKVGICIGLLLVCIGVNRFQTAQDQRGIEEKVIRIESGALSQTVTLSELEALGTSFEAVFKRRVGEPETHTYTGVSVEQILSMSDIEINEAQHVQVSSIDQYTVVLPYEEVTEKAHAYIVFEKDHVPLGEDSGPFMLVLKNDVLSTRWNRQVTTLEVE